MGHEFYCRIRTIPPANVKDVCFTTENTEGGKKMGLRKILLMMFVASFMAVGSAWAGDTVNVNTATAKQLQKVKGIGSKTAAKIIAYRDKNGPFKDVKDLLHVKGFGKKTLEKTSEELSLGDAEHSKAED